MTFKRNQKLVSHTSNIFMKAPKSLIQLLATESHLKVMKNVFYFTLKALFVLKTFKFFVFTFWSCWKTARLER